MLLMGPALGGGVPAKTQKSVKGGGWSYEGNGGKSFVVVQDSAIVFANGAWDGLGKLREYARAHAGTYVVFEREGKLQQVNDAEGLAALRPRFAKLAALASEQERLGQQQAPLAKEQAELGAKMRKAQRPEEMTAIGAQQSEVGRKQSAIGAEQGRVGNQQGTEGRTAYTEVGKLIEQCERGGKC